MILIFINTKIILVPNTPRHQHQLVSIQQQTNQVVVYQKQINVSPKHKQVTAQLDQYIRADPGVYCPTSETTSAVPRLHALVKLKNNDTPLLLGPSLSQTRYLSSIYSFTCLSAFFNKPSCLLCYLGRNLGDFILHSFRSCIKLLSYCSLNLTEELFE